MSDAHRRLDHDRGAPACLEQRSRSNIYHFAKTLQNIPFVEAVYLLNCGNKEDHPAGLDAEGRAIPLVWPAEVTDSIDIAIELGGAVSMEWMRRIRRRGGKAILHLCGQPYVALVEPTVFKREGFFLNPERFDEVWVLAKDMIFAPMMETMYRCPIREVPYLWSPRFLEETFLRDDEGRPLFGYTPAPCAPATSIRRSSSRICRRSRWASSRS